jgi:hypothetical protein
MNDIWLNVADRMKFYTKETFDKIPDKPGIYAWYLPLRIKGENPSEFVANHSELVSYDSSIKGHPVKNQSIEFSWDSIKLNLEKRFSNFSSEADQGRASMKKWSKIREDKDSTDTLKEVLMLSTLFTNPLYVGLTGSLITRFNQHQSSFYKDKNSFGKRFNLHSKSVGKDIKLNDLLFVTIELDDNEKDTFAVLEENEIREEQSSSNNIIFVAEMILKHLTKPPFGER